MFFCLVVFIRRFIWELLEYFFILVVGLILKIKVYLLYLWRSLLKVFWKWGLLVFKLNVGGFLKRIFWKIKGRIFFIVVSMVWLMLEIVYFFLNVVMIKSMKSRNSRIIINWDKVENRLVMRLLGYLVFGILEVLKNKCLVM